MKILIISENPHNTIGGIEKYNSNLIDLFINNGHDVHEFSFNFNPEKNILFTPNKKLVELNKKTDSNKLSNWKRLKNIKNDKKKINKIWKDYDLIINSTANIAWNKEIYNSNKWLYVQHFNKDFYTQKYIAGKLLSPIIYFGMWLIGIKNPFKQFQNFVFFTPDDKYSLIKNKMKNYYIVPICAFSKKEIKENHKIKNKQQNFIFFGRIDNKQKNIKYTKKLFTKNNLEIEYYGNGDAKLMIDDKYNKFKGSFTKDEIKSILPKYKFSVLLSKYEGFPYSIVESLSLGIIPISTSNCKSINWLLKENGYIVNKKNINKILNKCSSMDDFEIKKMSYKCINFAFNELCLEKFNEKWISILNDFNI